MGYHREQARDMKDFFPEETNGLSVVQVEEAWEEHSKNYSAGWLLADRSDPMDVLDVSRAMDNYRRDHQGATIICPHCHLPVL